MTMLSLRGLLDRKRDGGWGWVVLAAATLSQFCLGGVCLSGGLFYVIFRNALETSPVDTSWLCSLPITLWFVASPIGSLLTNKYGYRACAFIGGLLASTGLCIGYFATGIQFLFFSHGLLVGLGFGINFTGCMTAINVYFDKYKTVASGIASIGHNAGLITYARLIGYLDDDYGWRGSFLVHGAIVMNLYVFAAVMSPLNNERRRNCDVEVSNPLTEKPSSEKEILNEITEKSQPAKKEEKKTTLNFNVFRKLSFNCFCLSNVLVYIAQGIYILHLPSYASLTGFSKDEFGAVLVVYGIANIVGKVVYSFLGQHPKADVTILYTVSLAATGVFMGLTPVFLTQQGMLVLAALVGFFYCVTGALFPAVVFRLVGYERFADGVGMSCPFKATGNFIGGPLAGFLFSATGDYSTSFYLAGLSMVIGSVVMIQPIVHHRRNATGEKSAINHNMVYKQEYMEPMVSKCSDTAILDKKQVVFTKD